MYSFLCIQFIGPELYCRVNFKQSSGSTISFSWSATCVQSLSAVLQTLLTLKLVSYLAVLIPDESESDSVLVSDSG